MTFDPYGAGVVITGGGGGIVAAPARSKPSGRYAWAVSRKPPEDPVPRRLLSAATKLFAQKGFDRTTVQEIVETAGVTKGAMYHYFGSKDELLYEVYSRVLRAQTEQLEKVAVTEAPACLRLRDACTDVVVSTIDNLDDMIIFQQSMHQLSPEKRRAVRRERRRYHERFRSLIEEGQSAGEFRSDKPAEIVVDFFFGAVHHLVSWYSPSGTLSGRQVGEHYADLLLDSLRP